ncbi:hypothetical protein Tco_0789756 [Tanacetum coccineum]
MIVKNDKENSGIGLEILGGTSIRFSRKGLDSCDEGVFLGKEDAFGGEGDDDFAMGDELDEEALVEAMEEEEEEEEYAKDDEENEEDDYYLIKR